MVSVAFVAPYLLEATARFVLAVGDLPGVRLGLVTHEPLERLPEQVTGCRAGIGASLGDVVAGYVGADDRLEYTVIGDPVNEAARLTTLAKMEQGHVLASAAAIRHADAPEVARWVLGRSVELRGRGIMTQLARPLRPTLADRWQAGNVALRPAPADDTTA